MQGMYDQMVHTIAEGFGGITDFSNPTFRMMVMSGADAPSRASVVSSGGSFRADMAEGLLQMANAQVEKRESNMKTELCPS